MRLKDSLLDILYPEVNCPSCSSEGPLDAHTALCKKCHRELPFYAEARTLGEYKSLSVLWYEGLAAQLIKRMKYAGQAYLARLFAVLLQYACEQADFRADYVTYVPMYPAKMKERGFDQVELICRQLEALGYRKLAALTKIKDTPPQASLDLAARESNVKGSFMASGAAGKSFLLIDDVITTGSTITECAGTLKRAGAKSVCLASVARAR